MQKILVTTNTDRAITGAIITQDNGQEIVLNGYEFFKAMIDYDSDCEYQLDLISNGHGSEVINAPVDFHYPES